MSAPRATLRRAAALLALAAALAGARARGQEPVPDAPSVLTEWRTLGTGDGLPDASVRALLADGEDLWVGTDGGLAQLHAGAWRSWTARDGLDWPAVRSIAVDPATRDVWLGTWGGGLVRFSAGRFERWDQFTSGLAGDLVLAVEVVGPEVWAATNAGVSRFDWAADGWDLQLERRGDAPDPCVTALAQLERGVVAAAWCDGVWQLELAHEGAERRVALPERLAAGCCAGLAVARGALWVLGGTRLGRRDEHGAWSERDVPDLPSAGAIALCVSESGAAWVGAERSVWSLGAWDRGAWVRYDLASEPAPDRVRARALRPDAASAALDLPLPQGAGQVRCVAPAPDGVWVGTSRGLVRGSGPAAWSGARGLPPAAQPAQSAPAPARGEAQGALVLGVGGPFRRTVSLPGAPRARLSTALPDDVAVQLALETRDRWRTGAGAPQVEVLKEYIGLSPYAWTTPEDEYLSIVRARAPVALLACIDPDRRATTRIAAELEVPIVNVALEPASADERASGWIFRCPAHDPAEARRALDVAFDALGCRRPALLGSTEPLAEEHLTWWKQRAAERGAPCVATLGSELDGAAAVALLRATDFDVLLTWADETATAEVVRALRAARLRQPVLCSDRAATPALLAGLGPEAGALVAPQPCPHRLDAARRARFRARYPAHAPQGGSRPGPVALAWSSFDATCHLLAAIEAGASTRDEIRRALQRTARGRVVRAVDGRWQELPAGD